MPKRISVWTLHDSIRSRHRLEFADGLQGVVDLDSVIEQYTGVFAPLLDDDYFQRISLNRKLGNIVWPNGTDLCPDVLYSSVSGSPIVSIART